jgi:hypothetical protein
MNATRFHWDETASDGIIGGHHLYQSSWLEDRECRDFSLLFH